jgi:hypothetical protein
LASKKECESMKLVYGNYRLYPDSLYIFGCVVVTGMYIYLNAPWWVVSVLSFFVFALWAMNLKLGRVV